MRNLDGLEHRSVLYATLGSQVIEMMRFHLILSFNADKTIVAATAKSPSPSSAMFLVISIRFLQSRF